MEPKTKANVGSSDAEEHLNEAQSRKSHYHSCMCGTATHTPHETGTHGCVRAMTEAPIPSGTHETLGCPMWEVAGHIITDYSLREQRGYYQHPCGCWSWAQDSTNSIEA